MAQHLHSERRIRQLPLRHVRLVADTLQQSVSAAVRDRVSQLEEQPVALDNAIDLLGCVKACRRGAVAVLRLRRGAIEHSKTLSLGAQPPFDVLPIKRVVG